MATYEGEHTTNKPEDQLDTAGKTSESVATQPPEESSHTSEPEPSAEHEEDGESATTPEAVQRIADTIAHQAVRAKETISDVWYDRSPKARTYKAIGALAATGVLALGITSQVGGDTREEADGKTPTAEPQPGEGNQASGETIGEHEGGEADDTDEAAGITREDLETFKDQHREELEDGEQEAFLDLWEMETEALNGPRIEDHPDEEAVRQLSKEVVEDVRGRIEAVANASSPEAVEESVSGVRYLNNAWLLLENDQSIFNMKWNFIYKVSIPEEGGSDADYAWSATDTLSTSAEREQFMVVYPDQDEELQTLVLSGREASLPSDSSTRVIGVFGNPRDPEVVNGKLRWETLQDGTDEFIITERDGDFAAPFFMNGANEESNETIDNAWELNNYTGNAIPISTFLGELVEYND